MVAMVTALVSVVFAVTLFGLYLDLIVTMISYSGFHYMTVRTKQLFENIEKFRMQVFRGAQVE